MCRTKWHNNEEEEERCTLRSFEETFLGAQSQKLYANLPCLFTIRLYTPRASSESGDDNEDYEEYTSPRLVRVTAAKNSQGGGVSCNKYTYSECVVVVEKIEAKNYLDNGGAPLYHYLALECKNKLGGSGVVKMTTLQLYSTAYRCFVDVGVEEIGERIGTSNSGYARCFRVDFEEVGNGRESTLWNFHLKQHHAEENDPVEEGEMVNKPMDAATTTKRHVVRDLASVKKTYREVLGQLLAEAMWNKSNQKGVNCGKEAVLKADDVARITYFDKGRGKRVDVLGMDAGVVAGVKEYQVHFFQ